MFGAQFSNWGDVADSAYYTGHNSGELLWLLLSILLCILALWWGHRHESAANADGAMPFTATTTPTPTPPPSPAPSAKDDLKQIKGIGPTIEKKLGKAGVHTFAQIAGWSAAEQDKIESLLNFPGRIDREEWVKQAKTLAAGGETKFSKRVASGEVPSSS